MSKGQRQQSYETFKKNTIIQFWKITRKRYGNKSPFDKFFKKTALQTFLHDFVKGTTASLAALRASSGFT